MNGFDSFGEDNANAMEQIGTSSPDDFTLTQDDATI